MSFSSIDIPLERIETPSARASLSLRLGFSDNNEIQDWERFFQDFDRVGDFVQVYATADLDDDEKFLLMELILASATDGGPDFLTTPLWHKIVAQLKARWPLHAWTVWTWSCIDDESFHAYSDFVISPAMQALLLEMAGEKLKAGSTDRLNVELAIRFGQFWWQHFEGCEPTADILRVVFADRWVRFHSLPHSKRYPENEAERDEVSRRSTQLAEEVLGLGSKCWVIANRYPDAPRIEGDAVQAFELRPGLAWIRQDEPIEHCELVAYVKHCTWDPALFKAQLAQVALDQDAGLLWVTSAGRPAIFAPYDGGVDLILPDATEMHRLTDKYADWLSPFEGGL